MVPIWICEVCHGSGKFTSSIITLKEIIVGERVFCVFRKYEFTVKGCESTFCHFMEDAYFCVWKWQRSVLT